MALGDGSIQLLDYPITRLPDSRARRRSPRCALPVFLFPRALRHQAFSLVQPDLDADLPVRRVRFREAVIDVRTQRLQRQLPVQVPFGDRKSTRLNSSHTVIS